MIYSLTSYYLIFLILFYCYYNIFNIKNQILDNSLFYFFLKFGIIHM